MSESLKQIKKSVKEIEIITKENNYTQEIKEIISILEDFIRKKGGICYGGTAINNILPKKVQFYDKRDIPDYDFYHYDALETAKELADLYTKKGYENVQARAGVHLGTYKVFVNFLAIADITYLEKKLYNIMKKSAIHKNGIMMAEPNFLRAALYLELSRPKGDVSRWEKIFPRLQLLNRYHPIQILNEKNPPLIQQNKIEHFVSNNISEDLFYNILDTAMKEKIVFSGPFASRLILENRFDPIPDFIFIVDANQFEETTKEIIKTIASVLKKYDLPIELALAPYEEVGELIPHRNVISLNGSVIMTIYSSLACHNYNIKLFQKKEMRIATIDTIINLFLTISFVYRDKEEQRKYLYIVKKLIELSDIHYTGLKKRFSYSCIGNQKTLVDVFKEKTVLKKNVTKANRDKYFLNYEPTAINTTTPPHTRQPSKKNKKKTNKKNKTIKKMKLKKPTPTSYLEILKKQIENKK